MSTESVMDHPTISSSVIPFSSCPQSFPTSGSFLLSQLFASGGRLNKQRDSVQPWCTPFPVWSQSAVPCPVLTVASWPAYRFLKRQVRWSGIPISFKNFPQFIVIHTVKGFAIVNKAERCFSGTLLLFSPDNHSIFSLCEFEYSSYIWSHTVLILCLWLVSGDGNDNSLQCSCLENLGGRGVWWAAVSGVAQSWTRLKQLSCSSSWLVSLSSVFKVHSCCSMY